MWSCGIVTELMLVTSKKELSIALNPTYCIKSYFDVSVSKPSTLYRTVRNMDNIDRQSFIAELSSVSEFSFVKKAKQFCDILRTNR